MEIRSICDEELLNVQSTELEILNEIDRICKDNNITYYLAGGTLLGAVRHKGFIPWDDDIDIVMMREHYNRFIEVCKSELSDKYFLQNYKTDKEVPLLYTKIRKNNTLFAEENIIKSKCHKGIFVDIFPLDYIKKNNFLFKIKIFIHTKLKKIYLHNVSYLSKKNLKTFICHLFPRKISIFFFEKFIISKKKGEYMISSLSWYYYKKELFYYEDYGVPKYLEFEGKMFPIPSETEKILTQIYGNYMELPKEEDRISQHKVDQIVY